MAYKLQVIKTNDFIRLDGHGQPNLEESRRLLEKVAKACVDEGTNCALLDVRDVQGNLGLTDLYNLVSAFPAMGFRQEHRLAILHNYNRADSADFFAHCASTRGWNVRSFSNFEYVMAWFSEELPAT